MSTRSFKSPFFITIPTMGIELSNIEGKTWSGQSIEMKVQVTFCHDKDGKNFSNCFYRKRTFLWNDENHLGNKR